MWLILAPRSPPFPPIIEISLLGYCWGGLTWGNSLGWLLKPCGQHVEREIETIWEEASAHLGWRDTNRAFNGTSYACSISWVHCWIKVVRHHVHLYCVLLRICFNSPSTAYLREITSIYSQAAPVLFPSVRTWCFSEVTTKMKTNYQEKKE